MCARGRMVGTLGINQRSFGLPIFGPKMRFWIEKIPWGERIWKVKGDQNFLLISNPLRNAFAPSILWASTLEMTDP